ncbi:MAG: hypothetical protein AAGE52_26370 [Myxococcota bacterium]
MELLYENAPLSALPFVGSVLPSARPQVEGMWKIGSTIYVVSGAALSLLALWPEVLEPIQRVVFTTDPPEAFGRMARLDLAVAGALTAGSGMMIRRTLVAPVSRAGVARGLLEGLLTWYVLDTALSIVLGAPWNALGNTAFLALTFPSLLSMARQGATPSQTKAVQAH